MLYNILYPLADSVAGLNLFKYLTVRAGGAFATALLLSLIIGPYIINKFKIKQAKLKTVREDHPLESVTAKMGTPTMGGVLILITLLFSTFLWADLTNVYIWLTVAVVSAFGLIGFIDDYLVVSGKRPKGIPGKVRLLVQLIVCSIALYFVATVHHGQHGTSLFVPFIKDLVIPLGLLGFIAFGSIVIVGSANAVNLTDGLDGLATMPTAVAAGAFAFLAYVVGRVDFTEYLNVYYVTGAGELTVFCAALVGSCFGFLWYNAPPAKIFMGDTGSLTLGSSLGMVSVIIKMELVLAIVGGIFVMETLSVIAQVLSFKLTGKRIFRMAPIHHHFEQKGWAEPTIVIRFWIISIVLAIVGLATLKLR